MLVLGPCTGTRAWELRLLVWGGGQRVCVLGSVCSSLLGGWGTSSLPRHCSCLPQPSAQASPSHRALPLISRLPLRANMGRAPEPTHIRTRTPTSSQSRAHTRMHRCSHACTPLTCNPMRAHARAGAPVRARLPGGLHHRQPGRCGVLGEGGGHGRAGGAGAAGQLQAGGTGEDRGAAR